MLRSIFALLILVVVSSGATAFAGQSPAGIEDYRLGPGDRLKITVFGQPQESGEFEVDGAGNIAYPLLGSVPAGGKTLPELRKFIRDELNAKFIVDPHVSIEVLNYRPFYIYGEVNRAGSYPYVAGLTVRRAIAIAGGFTRRAQHSPARMM